MRGLYLAALLFSIAGMVVIDLRWRLFFRADARRASVVLALGVAFLLLWDVAGVGLGIFFRGSSDLLVGIQLRPEVPLEEVFFLVLLCYLTMNVYGAIARRLSPPLGEVPAKRPSRNPAPPEDGPTP